MPETLSTLRCPKCAGAMRSYERSGVVIDQCSDCRGVFLDRGELDRLIAAEERAYPDPPRADDTYDSRSGQKGSSHHGSSSSRKRRGGFLGELFD